MRLGVLTSDARGARCVEPARERGAELALAPRPRRRGRACERYSCCRERTCFQTAVNQYRYRCSSYVLVRCIKLGRTVSKRVAREVHAYCIRGMLEWSTGFRLGTFLHPCASCLLKRSLWVHMDCMAKVSSCRRKRLTVSAGGDSRAPSKQCGTCQYP